MTDIRWHKFSAVLATAALLVSACSSSSSPTTASVAPQPTAGQPTVAAAATAVPTATPKTYNMTMLTLNKANAYFVSMGCGGLAAAKDLGVNLTIQGTTAYDSPTELPMIDAIAATHPDAFIVVPGDPVGPYQALKTGFFDKKIPIVLTNSILTPNDIVTSTIRSDNQYGGSLAATAMLGLIGNKGKVVTISYIPGNPDTEGRRLGFENGVKAQSGVTDLGVQYGNDDPAKVAGIVSAILTTNPDIAGIFAVDNGTAGAVSTALAAAGKTGTVKLVTFDADSKQAQDLQNGVIQALIAQQPYAEGYIAVQQALYALTGQPTAPSIGTGFTVITKDNLAANQKAIYQDSCS